MDWVSIAISLLSSVIAATIAGVFSVITMKKQFKQNQQMMEAQKKIELLHNRPELEIISYLPITEECGYSALDLNKTPHIDVFVYFGLQESEDVMRKNLEKSEWVRCEYVLRNAGTQSLYSVEIFSQTSSLRIFDLNEHKSSFPSYLVMNSHAKYQRRRIHQGDTLLLRLWYHKNNIYGDPFSNPITIILKDFDKNYWEQPINAPYDFLEESRQISPEKRRELLKNLYDQ